jgi:pimeloyl-ACP methyl ester carboxylesterase
MSTENVRVYGAPPYKIALLHGGPGAAGEMEPVANVLSKEWGILEPLQTMDTLDGQLKELKQVLDEYGEGPTTLVGYSWGAMLGLLFASAYPTSVKKLILVSSGVFEDQYAKEIMPTRLKRMNALDREKYLRLEEELTKENPNDLNDLFSQLGEMTFKVDMVNPLEKEETFPPSFTIFKNVWNEAAKLRAKGGFIDAARKITCPVIVIHGDYDPHPLKGIVEPLSKVQKQFQQFIIPECGHTPWLERNAHEKFYEILKTTLTLM